MLTHTYTSIQVQLQHVAYDVLGTIDEGQGVLVVYDESPPNETYEAALQGVRALSGVVDALEAKVKKIS